MSKEIEKNITDLFIIGGGINGCGIARDASGRGLSVTLAEMQDLGSATSSASTKLFHGGLRYLEYFEFRLVREALLEREVLLKSMPHISWPMRFVLPYQADMRFDSNTPTSRLLKIFMPWLNGRRPTWLIRLGLFIYDQLGIREMLPGTTALNLQTGPEGVPLQKRFQKAYEYSDCWIDDSRLVILNARDAVAHGAEIMTYTKVLSASRENGVWRIETMQSDTKARQTHFARMLVNAGGPWVGDIIKNTTKSIQSDSVRLVRGSHIVTRKIYDHDKAYFFQGSDGRIIFAIPYENDFTLIGTTDVDHSDPSIKPECTPDERAYLVNFANKYFLKGISDDDIVWTYSGVRPLYDNGTSSATAATRDYTLKVDMESGAPMLNIFGGKITTYRRLAENALEKIIPYFPETLAAWTANAALPGGDFPADGFDALVENLKVNYTFLDDLWARRLVRSYGTEARQILGDAALAEDLGLNFGSNLTEREVVWSMKNEFARTAEDLVWRRSKLGLRLSEPQILKIESYMKQHLTLITPPKIAPLKKTRKAAG